MGRTGNGTAVYDLRVRTAGDAGSGTDHQGWPRRWPRGKPSVFEIGIRIFLTIRTGKPPRPAKNLTSDLIFRAYLTCGYAYASVPAVVASAERFPVPGPSASRCSAERRAYGVKRITFA
jgi:hypothetical protein